MQTTISAKGQITVPKSVRDALALKPGDAVKFFVESDHSVKFVPVTRSVMTLKGMLGGHGKVLSLDEMEQAIAAGIQQR